jgi:hypothetical protein
VLKIAKHGLAVYCPVVNGLVVNDLAVNDLAVNDLAVNDLAVNGLLLTVCRRTKSIAEGHAIGLELPPELFR